MRPRLTKAGELTTFTAQFLNALVRVSVRMTWRAPLDVAASRIKIARSERPLKLPPGITIEDVEAPAPGRWVKPATSNARAILYLHGGAFLFRLPGLHTPFVAELVARSGAQAYMPWYRLAPEHPFPAAPDDCLAAYRHLLDRFDPSDISVVGDSAGANLTLSLLHAIKAQSLPMPSRAIAISPITDFAEISASWLSGAKTDPMYPVQAIVKPQRHYLQGAALDDPRASPYYGDLSGFSPILCVAGGIEALRDDSVSFVKKATEAGVHAEAHIWRGMPHVFPLHRITREAAFATAEIVRWMSGEAPRERSTRLAERVRLFDVAALSGDLTETSNDASKLS